MSTPSLRMELQPVPKTRESVKLSLAQLAILREWADSTGKSLAGLIEEILHEAVMHYLQGKTVAVRKLNRELVGE